jgi:hypothetical protein
MVLLQRIGQTSINRFFIVIYFLFGAVEAVIFFARGKEGLSALIEMLLWWGDQGGRPI